MEINVKVKAVSKKMIDLKVNESDKIDQIIQKTKSEPGFEEIKNLIHNGKVLKKTMTVKEAGISNNSTLICHGCDSNKQNVEDKKLPRLSGLNGDTTHGFNMDEFISVVAKVMSELLKLSDEEIDKLLINYQRDLNIKSEGILDKSSETLPVKVKAGSEKKKKTKRKYKKKKRRTKKRKKRGKTKKKNMKGGWFQGPYGDNYEEFSREIKTDIINLRTDADGRTRAQHPEVVKILELMENEEWLRNLFNNRMGDIVLTARSRGLPDSLVTKLFMPDEDQEENVSLVERVIWYLWTVESNNSLYKLINGELRRNPTMTGSQLFPASFKYLTHMTKQKADVDCQNPPHGSNGYWRGESSVSMADGSETFWLMEKKLLHFEEGYLDEPDCPDEEERALFQAGFMSWTSNKNSTSVFLQGNNKVLFKLNGSIEITRVQGGTPVVNYVPNITTTLGRLRFFSAVGGEDEFLLDSGFLIFKCDGGKRYRIEHDAPYQRAYKYDVYYLSRENFPNYVIAKGIERLPTADRKRVVELMKGTLHPLFESMIDRLFSENMISVSNIKNLDIWEIIPEPASRSRRTGMRPVRQPSQPEPVYDPRWNCDRCTFENSSRLDECGMCHATRPVHHQKSKPYFSSPHDRLMYPDLEPEPEPEELLIPPGKLSRDEFIESFKSIIYSYYKEEPSITYAKVYLNYQKYLKSIKPKPIQKHILKYLEYLSKKKSRKLETDLTSFPPQKLTEARIKSLKQWYDKQL